MALKKKQQRMVVAQLLSSSSQMMLTWQMMLSSSIKQTRQTSSSTQTRTTSSSSRRCRRPSLKGCSSWSSSRVLLLMDQGTASRMPAQKQQRTMHCSVAWRMMMTTQPLTLHRAQEW
jgi:hypothetical protein